MPMTQQELNNKPSFSSKEEAYDALEDYLEHDCCDNFRFVFLEPLDTKALMEYEDKQHSGCCGSIDITVIVDGREALVGCNYGH